MRAWRGGWSWSAGLPGTARRSLLAEWARRGELPAAWLSLDAGDNDPARFWRHAVAALDRARPGIGGRLAPLLGPPAPSSFQGLVTALINDLAADQALLVLDDYHLISAQQVHESLSFLVEHRPPGICVVLASRSDPPLSLARLRARGQLTEIRVAELRFTPAEAAELLQHAASALPDASVAALAARTEGWAAGLQLAALSLRGHDDAAASWPRSPAATGTSWTTWPKRCSSGRTSTAHVPAGDVGARTAQRPVVRRRHRPRGQPGAARAGRAGGTVPDPTG